MDLFVEKGFIENFEIEFDKEKNTDIQRVVYNIFTQYTNIKLFIDISEVELKGFIEQSELLTSFLNYNINIFTYVDLKETIINSKSFQKIVLTEETKEWFNDFKQSPTLCFSYSSFEKEIRKIIENSDFKIDLSEKGKFNWDRFNFLKHNVNSIIISDPYIFNKESEIKNNLVQLLINNMNENIEYNIFIITDLSIEPDERVVEGIKKKIDIVNSGLANYKANIFLFNRIGAIEDMDAHDRLLYSNYVIVSSGKGFNINPKKSINSEIISNSIFSKYTYRRLNNHIIYMKKYIKRLRKYEQLNKPFKTNKEDGNETTGLWF